MSPDRSVEVGGIELAGVWKRFRVAHGRPSILREGLALVKRLRPERRWALRDIDLLVEPGDAIGLMGPNGSGKSTLLKVIAQVMYPYAGRVEVNGQVGAIIEIQAGLHGELTGRENIHLYGNFLGLDRRAVQARFDDIVAFADLEQAIDRKIKFYSSGMRMRLGFSVAAFLDPDILLVDEVLAVGDATFQQRCLDRMGQARRDGTTLVVVSHDLAAVEAVCERAVWLVDGAIQDDGPVREITGRYRHWVEDAGRAAARDDGPVAITRVTVSADPAGPPTAGRSLDIGFDIRSDETRSVTMHIGVSEGTATPIFLATRDIEVPAGPAHVSCRMDILPVAKGDYAVWLGVSDVRGRDLVSWHPAHDFPVVGPDLDPAPPGVMRLSPVQIPSTWSVE